MKITTIAEFLKRLAKTKKRKWHIDELGLIRTTIAGKDTCPALAAMGMVGCDIEEAIREKLVTERVGESIATAADWTNEDYHANNLPLRRRILKTLGLKESP